MRMTGYHTHSQRLERWLGREEVENISRYMRGFYWPIPLHGVPGNVHALPGGDFSGEIRVGAELSAVDRASETVRRINRNRSLRRAMSRRQLGAFANLSSIIAAATGGKSQDFFFRKAGPAANAIGNAMDLWNVGTLPTAGGASSAAPGGRSPTSATTGAIAYANPANANTGHFVGGFATSSIINNTLLLYDRLFDVVKTMNSAATEAVSGTFSRYQNQTATAPDFIGGNFCYPYNPTTVLANTAHNWTVCQYTDQAGNTGNSFASVAGVAQCVVTGVDLATFNWFMPLAAGDVGVKALTQMQCSATVATGTIDFVVAHPIAFFPCPVANLMCYVDGINTAFNLKFIYDNACLAFMEMPKPATSATTYSGQVTIVAE